MLTKYIMPKRLTTKEFIERANEVHNHKYDYSKTVYVNCETKVIITCPIHGDFTITPINHIHQRQGCKKCGRIKMQKTTSFSTEEFIKKAREKHGDKYDYSKVDYYNMFANVTIVCPEHGEFRQRPHDHLNGSGCPKCGVASRASLRTLTLEQFIEKARKIHGDKYNYSKVEYVNSQTKVCIICPEHGEFWQKPNSHLNGYGCQQCGGSIRHTTEEFIELAKKVHGDKYNYSQVEYVNNKTPVYIICHKKDKYGSEHGGFWQTPHSHICSQAQGCPKCNQSHLETEIKFWLDKNSIKYIEQHSFDWLTHIRKLFLDFYLPDYNIAIECQGRQHIKVIPHFNGESGYKDTIKRDEVKFVKCKEHGIEIFYYFEKEPSGSYFNNNIFTNKNKLLESIIHNELDTSH